MPGLPLLAVKCPPCQDGALEGAPFLRSPSQPLGWVDQQPRHGQGVTTLITLIVSSAPRDGRLGPSPPGSLESLFPAWLPIPTQVGAPLLGEVEDHPGSSAKALAFSAQLLTSISPNRLVYPSLTLLLRTLSRYISIINA